MAIAHLTEFDVGDDRSTTNYDAITERMGLDGDRPEGLLLHCAGFTDDGRFQMFDIWASDELQQRFATERLMPAIRAVAGDGSAPDRVESYELHHVVGV